MFNVVDCAKRNNGVILTLSDGKDTRLHMLNTGVLEQYMGAFGLSASDTLTLLLIDAHIEGIDAPSPGEPGAASKIQAMLDQAKGQLSWAIDRDQTLTDITLADDSAEMIKNTWSDIVSQPAEEPMTTRDHIDQMTTRNKALANGYDRLRQERLGDEMVADLEKQKKPPKTGSAGLIQMEFAKGQLRAKG